MLHTLQKFLFIRFNIVSTMEDIQSTVSIVNHALYITNYTSEGDKRH